MPGKDIDAIWAAMKAKNAPRGSADAGDVNRLMQNLNIGRGLDENKRGGVEDGQPAPPRPAIVEVAPDQASLPRHIAALTDPSQQIRRRALEQIKVM